MGTVRVAGHPLTVIQYGNASNTTVGDIPGSAICSQAIMVGCVSNTEYCSKDSAK